MSHCLPSKGTVLRLFNIVVQLKFKDQLFTCTFSARRPQGISELFLRCANVSVSDRRQSATSGDYRQQSATVGMYTSGRGPKKVHLSASIATDQLIPVNPSPVVVSWVPDIPVIIMQTSSKINRHSHQWDLNCCILS